MSTVSNTLKELGANAALFQPIFITLDPERDTPSRLKDYLANFGDDIVGLSGTPEEVAAVAKAYGVYYKKRPMDGGDYTLDHSTAFSLVSPEGRFMRVYKSDNDPANFASQLASAISGGKETAQ